MTQEERATPQIINGSRRNRIALGSGTSPSDVNRLVKQFSEMQKMMKRFGGMGTKGKKGGRLGALAGMRGGAMPDLSELGDLNALGGGLGDLPGLRAADRSSTRVLRQTECLRPTRPSGTLRWPETLGPGLGRYPRMVRLTTPEGPTDGSKAAPDPRR